MARNIPLLIRISTKLYDQKDPSIHLLQLNDLALCILFRMFKETGYSGDDDIYFALYLRELTKINIMRKICEKLSINHRQVAEVLVKYSSGATSILSDEIVTSLKFEQTVEIEFEAISQSDIWSRPDGLLMMIIRI